MTLANITIVPINPTIYVRTYLQMIATCTDEFSKPMLCPSLSWGSNDSTVISFADAYGKIMALKPGTATVYASYGFDVISNPSTITVICAPTECGFSVLQRQMLFNMR